MRAAIAFLVLFTALSAGAQDLTITSQVTRNGGQPETATNYITSDHLRMSQPEGGDVIMDLKSGDMTVIDNRKKTYYVVTKKDLDDMAAMMNQQMNSPEMKDAQEKMKNLPPDVQKRMESMMGGMMTVDVQKAGTSRTIAGYHCENWTIKVGQMSHTEECVTTELKFPAQSWERYRSYQDSMRSMMAAMGPMGKGLNQMREQFEKIKGFPIASKSTTSIMGHTSTTTSEVTSVKSGPVPASAWEIPAGYQKVDSPMKQAMQRHAH
ncbi:MAG TPA: DUF4412 domain-containing protein [Thermoanaerobaculia bacterium]|nr:DUF4412 domain-containing protein [Thermoanaerobaculia bacterium]